MRTRTALALALATLTACVDLNVNLGGDDDGATLRVVNGAATAGSVSVFVDGTSRLTGLGVAAVSAGVDVAPGTHTIEIRSGGGTAFQRQITFQLGDTLLAVALDSAGGVTPFVVEDSNAVVPPGATKLRIAHMAGGAPAISIWRTQPDWGTPSRVMFPFHYRDVSPYLQSTPGDWRIMVSSEDNTAADVPMPDTLANSGPVPVAAGRSRTAIVVDAAGGGLAIVVVEP